MKVLIDDHRVTLPDGGIPDLIVRNFRTGQWAIHFLMTDDDELYIDHDLGSEDDRETGYQLMCILEMEILNGEAYLPRKIECVSDNGGGRLRIQQVINKLYEWRGHESKEESHTQAHQEEEATFDLKEGS